VVAPSLRVPTQTGLPPRAAVAHAVAADVPERGRPRVRLDGDGRGRGPDRRPAQAARRWLGRRGRSDGSILTNYHVIHNKDGRLHDVFVIGRSASPIHAPQLWCAGRPSRGKLQRELDLALIKCDLDLDGRTWNPTSGTLWATLPEGGARTSAWDSACGSSATPMSAAVG